MIVMEDNRKKIIMEKIQATESVEKILAVLKAEGLECTAEKAEEIFSKLNKAGELTEEDLEKVAGGNEIWWEW